MDKQTRALRLVARLRQPFGALLLTTLREGSLEYKRVATDSIITVRVQEDADLLRVLRNILKGSCLLLDSALAWDSGYPPGGVMTARTGSRPGAHQSKPSFASPLGLA
ncbi:hypothetical protein OG21DRAFT_1522232 [Imleria badia]|nr:hypothetical protein OG21DRAFT_1522232 [Imleria badia]